MDIKANKEKIEEEIQKFTDYIRSPLPEYRTLQGFYDDDESYQDEIIKWNTELVEATQKYSQSQADYIYLQELLNKAEILSGREKIELKKNLGKYKNQFQTLNYTLRERISTIKQLIEATRSMQSHANSRPNY